MGELQHIRAVIERHRNQARALLETAKAEIEMGERLIRDGRMRAETARTRLRVVHDLETELDALVDQTDYDSRVVADHSTAEVDQGRSPSMVQVIDAIMADGQTHTIDEIYHRIRDRGYDWSRQSVVNRCGERVRQGKYISPYRGAYKLAASSSQKLPSGSAHPEGRRGLQPDHDSQQGAGQVHHSGSQPIEGLTRVPAPAPEDQPSL